ncbi:hypothetical protein [Aerococcus urinaeequi]|uniref:Uncharacterized protein n=1 Tax=Aerococcus urinaeequi TaxID=51665 RepID=A0A7M1KQM2_9LACT|nr:hypothetical protein [Aerococcus urinaeequi]QOQ78641.1 hypothetical protein IMX20_06485 [Aerococcus urinaeequi]
MILQQFPIIFESFYQEIRLIIYFLFSILIVFSLSTLQKVLQHKLFFLFSMVLIYSALLSFISQNNIILNLGIPVFVVLISLGIKFDEEELKKILLLYVVGVTLMGLAVVFYYADGFSITVTYAIPAKNQRGPMIGYAILISFMSVFKDRFHTVRFLNRNVSFILFSLNFLVLLTFRNRASILGIALCAFFILFSSVEYKQTINKWFLIFFMTSMFIILSLAGFFDGLYSFMWDSITLNYDITDLESLSAGRTDTYIDALRYSLKNPVAGEILAGPSVLGTPHNYILYNWVRYGIVMSLPMILYYLYLWFFSLKGIMMNQNNSLPVWLLLFSLIVSMFEYTYPYGPGVSQFFMWFLLGQYLLRHGHQEY